MIIQIVCVYLCYPCTDRSNISGLTAVTGVMSSGGSTVREMITMYVSWQLGYIARSNTIFCKIKDHKVHLSQTSYMLFICRSNSRSPHSTHDNVFLSSLYIVKNSKPNLLAGVTIIDYRLNAIITTISLSMGKWPLLVIQEK